jgi:hypothetical protein
MATRDVDCVAVATFPGMENKQEYAIAVLVDAWTYTPTGFTAVSGGRCKSVTVLFVPTSHELVPVNAANLIGVLLC